MVIFEWEREALKQIKAEDERKLFLSDRKNGRQGMNDIILVLLAAKRNPKLLFKSTVDMMGEQARCCESCREEVLEVLEDVNMKRLQLASDLMDEAIRRKQATKASEEGKADEDK